MTTVAVPQMIGAPLQERRWVRNGMLPDASLQGALCGETNQIARYRVKEVFHNHGMMGFDSGGSDALLTNTSTGTDRDRWIFRCHSGPFAKRFYVRFLSCQLNTVDAGHIFNPASRLRITTSGGTTIGDALFYYGNTGVNASNIPANYGWGTGYIDVSPNQDYVGILSDINGNRLISATVYEVSVDPDTANGYLPSNYTAQQAIYDADRSGPSSALYGLWKHNGYPCFNWTVDVQSTPQVNNLLTYKNVIDVLSTGHDATTPGFTVDLTNCARLSQASSGIPAMLYVFGKWGGAGTGGNVRLLDTNNWLASTVLSGFNTTGQWLSTPVNLYPGSDKYDLQFASTTGGTNFSVMAASLYLYES